MANQRNKNYEEFTIPSNWNEFKKKYEKELEKSLDASITPIIELITKQAPTFFLEALLIQIKKSSSDDNIPIIKFNIPGELMVDILKCFAFHANELMIMLSKLFQDGDGKVFAESTIHNRLQEIKEKIEEERAKANEKDKTIH